MIKVSQNVYRNVVDASNPNNAIPRTIGLQKGDIIVYNAPGSPVRFPAGNVADKVPVTDPTSPLGWTLKSYSAGGGSGGGGSALITLVNNTGSTIIAGTVVTYDEEGGEREIRKATADDGVNLFITSDDSPSGENIDCYACPYTICNVMCTSDAVEVGDKICVSATDGLAMAGSFATIGTALTAKAAGSNGVVKVQLGMGWTMGTTDLEEGTTSLPAGHLYFYYEVEES